MVEEVKKDADETEEECAEEENDITTHATETQISTGVQGSKNRRCHDFS